MKNLNTMKKAELIEMVKELQAKVEELTRVPEPEVKPEETVPNKKHEDIMNNPRVIGKPMSDDQLKAVINITATYEVTLPANFHTFDVNEVSEIIRSLDTMIKQKQIVKRKSRYNPAELYQRFLQKYPEAYDNIINRNM